MISQKTQLETKINERDYTFHCALDAPLNDAFAAVDTFRSYLFGRIKEVEELQKASQVQSEDAKPE